MPTGGAHNYNAHEFGADEEEEYDKETDRDEDCACDD